jgi:hypothetical protein
LASFIPFYLFSYHLKLRESAEDCLAIPSAKLIDHQNEPTSDEFSDMCQGDFEKDQALTASVRRDHCRPNRALTLPANSIRSFFFIAGLLHSQFSNSPI